MVLRMVHGIGFSTFPTNTIKHHQTPSTTKVFGIAISEPYNYRGMCQYLWDHGNLEWGTKIISSVRTCAYAYVRSFAVANVTTRSVNRPILSPVPSYCFWHHHLTFPWQWPKLTHQYLWCSWDNLAPQNKAKTPLDHWFLTWKSTVKWFAQWIMFSRKIWTVLTGMDFPWILKWNRGWLNTNSFQLFLPWFSHILSMIFPRFSHF